MRVLFPLHGFVNWNGGLDLVRLMSSALMHPVVRDRVELVFALPQSSAANRVLLGAIRNWRAWRAGSGQTATDAGSTSALLRVAAQITAGSTVVQCADRVAGIVQASRQVGADIVFPTMVPLGPSPLPRIGYLFDFQHHYLPHLFSARIRHKRDRQFRRISRDADGIVVNSRVVAADVTRILGVDADRILAMPFAPYAQPWWFDGDPTETKDRFGINGRYLLVCNHFWTHKDHATALRAFAFLRQDTGLEDVSLVLTGDPIDHRDPRHYARLLVLADELGIAHRTHFLGLVSKGDQLTLLRGAAALLQPTLFEGGPGGGSVYEAIGLGVPAIVSDIPINREIDRGHVTYFEAGNAIDLVRKATAVLAYPDDRPCKADLLAESDANLASLATSILNYLGRFTP